MLQTNNPDIKLTTAPGTEGELCVLTSRQVEGPFYFPSPERKDIREDRKGKDMNLRLQVLRSPDCSPLEGAIVEIWHTDAEGIYSGYPQEIAHDMWKTFVFMGKNGKKINGEYHADPVENSRFLRGLQRTDADGWVEFNTIFPGWYEGRVPHIHFKIFIGEQEHLTAQFYFDPEFQNSVYTSVAPYNKHGKCPLTFQNDIALAASTETVEGLLLKPEWSEDQALEVSARIGVQHA